MTPTYTSMTRISDLETRAFRIAEYPREQWEMGDYVAVRVERMDAPQSVELPTGRLVELAPGDVVVGALGRRHATLELTGDWRCVGEDGRMAILTGGGLLGKCTSRSAAIPPPAEVGYLGHAVREGGHAARDQAPQRKLNMEAFVPGLEGELGTQFRRPTVMIIGTSMSAGKTATAKVVIRRFRRMGLRVTAAKVTGAGRYRDVLTMGDAGADPFLDFVDAGLPSSVCSEERYRGALDHLLGRMARAEGDVAVVEVGASPLEPYNGTAAVERLEEAVGLCILCASDPYSVVGLIEAFGRVPDLVTGITANTRAGVELVEKLVDVPCIDVRDPDTHTILDELLEDRVLRSDQNR